MKKIFLLLLLVAFPSLCQAQVGVARFSSTTPTIDAGAYLANDLIGTLLTFSNVFREQQPSGYLVSVCITDKAAQASDMDLYILREPFSSSTVLTNNGPFDPADSDLNKIIAVVALGSTSRFSFTDNGVKCLGSLTTPVWSSGTSKRSLYGVLVARGTPTFASTSDLTITVGVSRD